MLLRRVLNIHKLSEAGSGLTVSTVDLMVLRTPRVRENGWEGTYPMGKCRMRGLQPPGGHKREQV
ncbi:hypothetical protein DL89DRAFT_268411 [Linderina pennispora]|uniref:Uncharacterized protein n=1 Tax=Linderina pennispora TaxID=61395 RepID=A0A1Y1W4Y6_9FUNG|nr:uncharacterized protein DL89DRAFT_268411 [Linderina pennispora]ORX68613.1 hypothetical protein DL89DRAFT_268411 [Linderina pennispora]